MRLLLADGRVVEVSDDENQELFRAALCSFGTLGVVSTVVVWIEERMIPFKKPKRHFANYQ